MRGLEVAFSSQDAVSTGVFYTAGQVTQGMDVRTGGRASLDS